MKEIKFMRYGGLSPVKQTQYLSDNHPDKGFHNPPRKRGLYAFIKGYEDLFLIGSSSEPNHISGKSKWLKDENDDLIEDTRYFDENKNTNWGYVCPPELKKILKKKGIKETQLGTKLIDGKSYLTVLKQPKIFTYKGELWHHLLETTEIHEIIEISGSWVKTSYDAFVKAFNKDKHITLKELYKNFGFDDKCKDPYIGPGVTYTKDHLEIFIEKIKQNVRNRKRKSQ